MKSVTIRDHKGQILIKVVHRKNGSIDTMKLVDLQDITIEVRDNDGKKVWFNKGGV